MMDRLRARAARERFESGEDVLRALEDEIEAVLVSEPVLAEAAGAAPKPRIGPGREAVGPEVVLFVGVNGTGKTTSIAKLAHRLRNDGKNVLLAAADTFRAAAIEQVEIWAKRLGLDLVRHERGSDPAAVVYDAIQAARARGADTVLVDTAGRLHTYKNLMDELKKVKRIAVREVGEELTTTLLVVDATTGQNGIVQARQFNDALGVDGVLLAKLDGTARGGIVIAIQEELGIPVLYVGLGEGLDDLQEFVPRDFARALVGTA